MQPDRGKGPYLSPDLQGPCQDNSRGHPALDLSWEGGEMPYPRGAWDLALLEGVRVTSKTHKTRHHQPLAFTHARTEDRHSFLRGANMEEQSPRPGEPPR